MDICITFILIWLVIAVVALAFIFSATRLGTQPPKFAKQMAEMALGTIGLVVPYYIMDILYWSYNIRDGTEWGICIGLGVVIFIIEGYLWTKVLNKHFPEQPSHPPQYSPYPGQYQAPVYPAMSWPQPQYQAAVYTRCIYCGADFPPGAPICARCGARR